MVDDSLDIARKRLRFRSWHRGTREADLLLGGFADRHLDGFDAAQLAAYAAVLEQGDPDIWDWLIGGAVAPAELDAELIQMMRRSVPNP